MAENPDELIPTRWSLVERLKDASDQQSWREFFETYRRLILGVALKSGLTEAEAEEVLQETVISVAERMPVFKADPAAGSFKSWLLLVTRRRIADQFRKRPPEFESLARPTDQTARKALSVNLGQVYLAKHRMARLLRQEIKKLEGKLI